MINSDYSISHTSYEKIVLVIPGLLASKNADRFLYLESILTSKGFSVCRCELKNNNLGVTCLQTYKKQYEGALQDLSKAGYTKIHVVAESFGSVTVLNGNQDLVDSYVFWNPVLDNTGLLQFKIKKQLASFYTKKYKPLTKLFFKQVKLLDPKNIIPKLSKPALIIHGTHDKVIDIDATKKLLPLFQSVEFCPAQGSGHLVTRDDFPFFTKTTDWLMIKE